MTIGLILILVLIAINARKEYREWHRHSKRWTLVQCKNPIEYEEYINKLGHKTVRYVDGVYVKDIDKEM